MVIDRNTEEFVDIETEGDIISVRKSSRKLAETLGFGITDITRIVTACSELARNVYLYAGTGRVHIHRFDSENRVGVEIVFADNGPGISDVRQAMENGYTTSGGLGMGLPGAKRLMDEIDIQSESGKGTTIKIRKWLR